MGTCLVSNVIKDPSGLLVSGVQVQIDLVPAGAFRVSDGTEVAPRMFAYTDLYGNWSTPLEQQSNIIPAGSYYKISEFLPEAQGGTRMWLITVPNTGTASVSNILVTPPRVIGTIPDYLTKQEGDAYYAPIGSVNTIAPSNVPLKVVSYSEIIA